VNTISTDQAAQTHAGKNKNRHSTKLRLYLLLLKSVENKTFFLLLTLLALTSTYATIMADDYYLATRFLDPGLLPKINDASIWNLFSVSDGHFETNQYLVQNGLMTWWTSPDFRFEMWRPLAEISHWIDFTLWPKQTLLMHLHQLFWVFLFYYFSFGFFTKFCEAREIAIIAFILFALSANHAQTIAWIAGRNTLMAASFGIAALLLHVKSVETKSNFHRALALLAFACALLSSEFGLSASVWLFAWTLTLDKDKLLTRFIRLVPYGTLMLCWAIIYKMGNHGVYGSDFYMDPASNPIGYLGAFVEKAPTAQFNSIFHIPAGIFGSGKLWQPGWFISIAMVSLLLFIIRSKLTTPLTQFFLLGSFFSLIPIAAGSSGARTLAFVSLGTLSLTSAVLHQWVYGKFANKSDKRLSHIFLWPVILLTVISIGTLPVVSVIYRNHNLDNYFNPAIKLPITEADAGSTVVLINPNSVLYSIFYPLARSYEGLTQPASFYTMASSKKRELYLTRDARNSFVLTTESDTGFLAEPAAYFMRSKQDPFKKGQLIKYRGLTIEVLSLLEDGRPASIRAIFDRPMESENLKLIFCEGRDFHTLTPPALGESITIPVCH
jgi:hypothetical protein